MTKIRKKEMRAQYLEIRKQLGETSVVLNDQLTKNLISFLPSTSKLVVAGYDPVKYEINPAKFMTYWHALGYPVGLPVVINKGYPLIFRLWHPDLQLQDHKLGGRIPPNDQPEIFPDIILVPLIAFDRLGNRLGYGGGYYDRTLYFLRRYRPVKAIGLAFSCQESLDIPVNKYDQKLDTIVTDREVILC